ncbi:pimeloyl-ACP methyl ester carboxylesterase [Micromonospora kangleipakensis]|uniref:Pimeloyl-ACP methyl ester carboxylesterase n=1 Tax=Micromonospora kangleipakensis TaxID=1077942 RepID=A0A4Q8BDX5_9ACTN|nr:alpha/beta hydrolase [Micromonospora kangleipakensis]RZU75868.1 pimeloyl-ACP methyl ester carboxylesterase [Micromonospora kangleipakensis]
MFKTKRALRGAAFAVVAVTALAAVFTQPASASSAAGCDEVPTGVRVSDHWLHFKVPPGLMPDPQFDDRPAKLEVHRVRPVYAHGKCSSVSNRAAVLIHGRSSYGPAVFDLRQPAPEGGELSVQKALARAGIDTFAPNLLGYGRSTRFDHGLDDPSNASLRAYTDGTCEYPEGCDRTHVPLVFPLDQQGPSAQGPTLFTNPLGGQRRAHSSNFRFARVDTFVRDIRQVIDDAIARAQPSDGKVTLLGYSSGGQAVGRTLYKDNPNPLLPNTDQYIAKVNRVVFLSSLFFATGPTEEPPPAGFATFPLHVFNAASVATNWQMTPPGREAACTGHVVPGSREQVWTQVLEGETLGLEWGGNDPAHPTGLARSPVFSSYGWNREVAGKLTTPALVIHGDEDQAAPATNADTIYSELQMTNKVKVKVACASHALLSEGCSGQRCTPASGTPYGGKTGTPWAGPHSTLKAALIEWISSGTFDGAPSGEFTVNESGVATGP